MVPLLIMTVERRGLEEGGSNTDLTGIRDQDPYHSPPGCPTHRSHGRCGHQAWKDVARDWESDRKVEVATARKGKVPKDYPQLKK